MGGSLSFFLQCISDLYEKAMSDRAGLYAGSGLVMESFAFS